MTTIYKGFSTINQQKKFRLTDYELIKRDILNHFSIRRGEKLMNPTFGTVIWDLLFDPLTDETRNAITADVKKIAAYEVRVSVDAVIVTQFDQGLQIELELTYLQTNQTDKLVMQFDRDSVSLTVVQ